MTTTKASKKPAPSTEDYSGVWYVCSCIDSWLYGKWGAGRTVDEAKAAAKKAGGKFRNYYVSKLTQRQGAEGPPCINDMGGLTWWPAEGDRNVQTVEKVAGGKIVPADQYDNQG